MKRINERKETEIIDAEEMRKRAAKMEKAAKKKSSESKMPEEKKAARANTKKTTKRPATKRGPSAKKHDMAEVDKMLLTQSLRKDLNLDD